VWGVQLEGDLVYASDINSGLWIFRIGEENLEAAPTDPVTPESNPDVESLEDTAPVDPAPADPAPPPASGVDADSVELGTDPSSTEADPDPDSSGDDADTGSAAGTYF
jgi:hypothetical protein